MKSSFALALGALGAFGTTACGLSAPWTFTEPRVAESPAANDDDRSRPSPLDRPMQFALAEDFVVRVVVGEVTCSGALVGESLVLTAHHCVSARDKNGDIVASDVAPSAIAIELGGDYLPWGEVGVRAVVAPPCGHGAGNGDIALLVLERPLVGVETRTPLLDAPPVVGEDVTPVGFGRCALSEDGVRRHRRHGGKVDTVRPDRFRLNAAICPGDSGGPAVTETGAVLGVISRSAMDGSASTVGRSEFTRLDHWRPVFASAQLIADGATPAEVPPIEGCDLPPPQP